MVILIAALIGIGPVGIILALLLFYPEKIEKWSALLWKLIGGVHSIFRFARKKHIKHDLQGRVNDYVRRLRKNVPGSFNDKLEIDWIDSKTKRESLLADGRIVIRLRAEDPEDHNLVHASYLYVSKCLLKKTKRYLSPPQKEALDIFVSSKILREEKPEVVAFFLDEYLHPKTEDSQSKVSTLMDDFGIIDKAGLFFPLLLQELEFLGEKVFGRKRSDLITREVYQLINFLRPISQRTVGDHGDLDFDGSYTRFGIVIIGRSAKLAHSIAPYINYINKELVAKDVESIYVLGSHEHAEKIDEICAEFDGDYYCTRSLTMRSQLRHSDRVEQVKTYLKILRRRQPDLLIPSEAGA